MERRGALLDRAKIVGCASWCACCRSWSSASRSRSAWTSASRRRRSRRRSCRSRRSAAGSSSGASWKIRSGTSPLVSAEIAFWFSAMNGIELSSILLPLAFCSPRDRLPERGVFLPGRSPELPIQRPSWPARWRYRDAPKPRPPPDPGSSKHRTPAHSSHGRSPSLSAGRSGTGSCDSVSLVTIILRGWAASSQTPAQPSLPLSRVAGQGQFGPVRGPSTQ